MKPGLTLGVAYKYLWMGGASWNLDDSGASGTSDDLEMDSLGTHSILAFISYRF